MDVTARAKYLCRMMSRAKCGGRVNRSSNRFDEFEYVFGTSIIFVATTLVGVTLLSAALLIYIAELIGSWLVSLLVIGGVALVISLTLYFAILRPCTRAIRREIRELYRVSTEVSRLYRWVKDMIHIFFN